MATTQELQRFISEPREDLAVEYKGWLDLTAKGHKAAVAKAAIALANQGGGHIVIGFEETGRSLVSGESPASVPEITQDAVNAAVHRYAEPGFHCEVHFVPHPTTGVLHPVVVVPGGMTVPVMSKREQAGIVAQNRYYIRKPGPVSEEPLTGEEWRALIERCVRASREDMLDSIRSIVTGRVEAQNPVPDALGDLRDYSTEAHERWRELVTGQPNHSPSRFPHGYYEMAFALVGSQPTNSLSELQRRLSAAGQIRMSGWPPFLDIQVPGLNPEPVEDYVEAWLGGIARNGNRFTSPNTCDFWQASRNGKLYTIRGYDEDGRDDEPPAQVLYFTSPISRIAEGLLFASRLAEKFEEVEQIAVHCRFTGLKGRRIAMPPWMLDTLFGNSYPCSTDDLTLTGQATLQQLQDNLAEWLHYFLQIQLYEKFSFFQLPFDTLSTVVQSLKNRRF